MRMGTRLRSALSRSIVAFALGATAIVISACGGGGGGGGGGGETGLDTSGGTSSSPLIVNTSVPISTLDPTFTVANLEAGLAGSLYSTLTKVKYVPGPEGSNQQDLDPTAVEPYVAKSWKWSDGKRTLTFKLRPGLTFPSGEPVDADAVAWSLNRTIKAEAGGYAVLEETDTEPPLVKSVTAPDPSTVVIKYKRPAPNQLAALATPTAGAIYDPKVVEENGGQQPAEPNKYLSSHAAGYGPYLLKSYQPNHQIALTANPDFFEPPKSKEVIINFITDNQTLLLDAQSGSADITLGMTAQAASSLVENPCCIVVATTSRNAQTLNFPQTGKVPEFENQKFRQALATAFPYEEVLEKIGYGFGDLYNGEWMPSFGWYDKTIGAPIATDVAKAEELIAESGVETPVSFPIYVSQGDNLGKELATVAAGAWEPLGVDAEVKVAAPAAFLEVVYGSGAGASVFLDGPQVVAPDYYWAYDLQCAPNDAFNDTKVCLPQADKLMKKLPYISDEAKRQELVDQVDKLYIEDAPRIWVYNNQLVTVLSGKVTNYYASDLPEVRLWSKGE